MANRLLSLYGLKFNPFGPELPLEALLCTPAIDNFCWRIEHSHVPEGGFALITGDPGMGKSVVLRMLADRLQRMGELSVAAVVHPQSNLADFYRELGDLFGIELRPSNRWGGFKALRHRWGTHIESQRLRPVLLIDEVQEMSPAVLSELRLLSSDQFDARLLISVILAGDGRLTDRLRREELLPLSSRIRTRLLLEHRQPDELYEHLHHVLTCAGNNTLMSKELMRTLCDRAAGNLRILMGMAGELLAMGAQRELPQLNEKLFLEYASPGVGPQKASGVSGRKKR